MAGVPYDVVVDDGRSARLGTSVGGGDLRIAGNGAALLPGLHETLCARLAGFGITGVTDATPKLSAATQTLLSALPQDVTTLTADPVIAAAGPRKVVVSDHELPGPP